MLGKNLRLIAIATAAAVMIACETGKTSEEHIASAQQFIANADAKAAIIELKNALQQNAEDAEARWLLGKLYLEAGNHASAEKELRRARQAQWRDSDVLPALAEALLFQGKYVEVRDLKNGDLPPAAAASLLSVKAMSELAQGELAQAENLIKQARSEDPKNAKAMLAEARLDTVRGDLPSAMRLLDRITAENPRDWSAWSLQGEIKRQQQDQEGALLAYNKVLELRPNAFSERVKRALMEIQEGAMEAAQSDADILLKQGPNHPLSNYVQGLIYFQKEQYKEAITSLSAADSAANQYPLILFFLGTAHLKENNLDQAEAHAAKFHYAVPDAIPGRKLLATIRLQQRQFAEAKELLGPALDASPNDVQLLNLMASAALAIGDTDAGIALLGRAAELEPDSAAARMRLGAGLMMGGKEDQAAQQLTAALELNPEFQQADILLVMGHVVEKDFDAAIKSAKAYIERHPGTVAPYNLLGKVYLAADQRDKAAAAFQRALKLAPGDSAANHNLASLALADGDKKAALAYYNTVLEQDRDHLPTLLRLADLAAKSGDESQFVGHLEHAMNKHPDALAPRLMLAEHYLNTGKSDRITTLFNTLSELQKLSPEILSMQARSQLANQDFTAASNTLGKLKESANNATIHHMKAVAAAGVRDGDTARLELQKSVELDEQYFPARLALARLALAENNGEEFDRHLSVLTKLDPESSAVLALQAVQASRGGDPQQAEKLAAQAFQQTPSTSTVTSLANFREKAGNTAGALELRQQWVEKNPRDVVAIMALADQLQRLDQPDKARGHYEKITEIQPDNIIALNNLAWNLRTTDPETALGYARKAADKAPKSAAILDTLAVVEYHNKDYERAQRTIDKALRISPGEPSLRYHSAMIAAATKQPQGAVEILEKLVSDKAEFPERDQADQLLKQLKASD